MPICKQCKKDKKYSLDWAGRCGSCRYDNLPKPYECVCQARFPSLAALAGHIGGSTLIAGNKRGHKRLL